MKPVVLLMMVLQFDHLVSGQKPSIEILPKMTDKPNTNAGLLLVDMDQENFPSYAKSWEKICVNGLYGFYTTPSYGSMNMSYTTVTPVAGNGRADCASAQELLKTTNSVRRLGGGKPAMPPVPYNLGAEQVVYYKHKFFLFMGLSEISTTTVSGTTGTTVPVTDVPNVASFVITGYEGLWKLCDSSNPPHCICLDLNKGKFMVPDLDKFPAEKPLKKLATFEWVPPTTPALCDGLARPNGLV